MVWSSRATHSDVTVPLPISLGPGETFDEMKEALGPLTVCFSIESASHLLLFFSLPEGNSELLSLH